MRFAVLIMCVWSAAGQNLYRIEAFAGSEFAGDGKSALAAPLLQPQGIAVERDGSILVADAADHRVRRITPAGFIQTVAGDGVPGFGGDTLPAKASRLQTPYGVAVGPNGEIYIADLGNGRVRVIGPDGVIRTFAGGGETVPADLPIRAADARLLQPRNVALDSTGAVYISDFSANRVFRVSPNGMLLPVAGTGEPGDSTAGAPAIRSKLKGPAGLALDAAGTLYVADSGNRRVRKIANGWMESVTDAKGNTLDFGAVTSLTLDRTGRLHTAGGMRIPIVGPTGILASVNVAADEVLIDTSGRLLTVAHRQVRWIYQDTSVRLLAGSGLGAFVGDGSTPEEWRFQRPAALTRDASGHLYIADSGNGRIRRIANGKSLSTVTEGLGQPAGFAFNSSNLLYFSDSKPGIIYGMDRGGRLQLFSRGGGSKPFRNPSGLAFDARGDLYVADTGNNLIRKVTPDGFVSTVAGGGTSVRDGFALSLELKSPAGLAISPEGEIWFTETGRLRKLSIDGYVQTIAGVPVVDPKGIGFDSKSRLWIADAGAHRILRLSGRDKWEIVAGQGDRGFSGDDGPALQAMLDSPSDVWPEIDGSILIADTGNHRIRRITPVPDAPPAVVVPPAELVLASFRIFHAGTLKLGAVAPGQIVYIDCDQTPPPGAFEVRFGSEPARILSVEGVRIAAIVPRLAEYGPVEVSINDATGRWAAGPAEIAALAPAVVGGIENENGSVNGAEAPALRGSIVTLYITGEGNSAEPAVTAELAGIESQVVAAERLNDRPGIFKISLQVPGGFLPSGSLRLQIWVNGVKAAEDVNVICQ